MDKSNYCQLVRTETGPEGTFGRLFFKEFWWYSGELPWLDNQANISCIPEGQYPCEWTYSPRFRKFLYAVNNVPKRAGIRLHPANYCANEPLRKQLNGCISLGKIPGKIEGQRALLQSVVAVSEFQIALDHQPFILEVRNEFR